MDILIVEDDETVLKIIAKMAKKFGHNVVTATNGKAGLDIFLKESLSFDAIISDVMMPEMDGLELLQRIRQYNADIPFVISTGFGDTPMAIKALKHGATDFLQKPYDSKVLLGALYRIESILNSKQSIEKTIPYITPTFQTNMPSKTELIPGLVGLLQTIAKPYCQLYGINICDISTSLAEALTNAVVHGNLDIPSSLKEQSWEKFQEMLEQRESMPKYNEELVYICFQIVNMDDKHNGNICKVDRREESTSSNKESTSSNEESTDTTITKQERLKAMVWDIVDNGKGFDYSHLPSMNEQDKYLLAGRGLFLVRSFMDKVSWNEMGNAIKMVKYLNKRF